MNFDQIFEAYYTLYRGESETPDATDEEYTVALRLANEALNRWENFDGTYWNTLFTSAQTDGNGGVTTVSTGTVDYLAPTSMREAGGYVRFRNPGDGSYQASLPIINPQEAQFKNDNSRYAYFSGSPATGYVLHINPSPGAEQNGQLIDYVYYRKASPYTIGASISEVPDPYFIVQRMLAQRFRVSRNFSGYQTALRDAEEALKNMQRDNNSGSWANPWKLQDNSGSVFGASSEGSWRW